jgi:5-methylcytosine-specific restriction endonuclease McrA
MLKRMLVAALLVTAVAACPGCKKAQPKSDVDKALEKASQDPDKSGTDLQKKLDEALKK